MTAGKARSSATRMLAAAADRILSEGMTVGLEGVRMEEVIKDAGVSRATAYRHWPSRDLFIADVLVEVVRRTTLIPERPEEIHRLLALVDAHAAGLDSPDGRRALVVEALRVSIGSDVHRILDSPEMRTFISLSATYQGLPEGPVREAVGAALIETEHGFIRRRAAIYANLAMLVGYRLRDGSEGFEALSSAAGLMMTGIVMRALPDPQWLEERRTAAPFGGPAAQWSEPERLIAGILLGQLEPDETIDWDQATIDTFRNRFERQVADILTASAEPPTAAP